MDPTNSIRIPEFYKDGVIFITGATGFLGKALLDKLLRSCSDLKKIYILLRRKKGEDPQERWHKIIEEKAFSWLRANRADMLKTKVVVLEGDVRELRLGLSDQDYSLLQETVTQIFHVAATVRFDEPINEAILMNTRGTWEVVQLALGARNIKALVHVSTTFCNPLQRTTEEIVYPPPANWRDVIRCAENLDPFLMSSLQPKLLSGYPNTYTFAKNLAESVIWEYRNQIPVVIVRPSVVSSSVREPFPAYIDNLNGPVAILIGSASFVLRNTLTDKDCYLDYVAVDEVVQLMIASAWFTATRRDDLRVFNLSNPEYKERNDEFAKLFLHISELKPLANQHIILVDYYLTTSKLIFKIRTLFNQVLPAYLVDLVWKAKPISLVRIQIKIIKSVNALHYFMNNYWNFPNENARKIRRVILPEDQDDFGTNLIDCDVQDYCMESYAEAAKVFLKVDMTDEYTQRARKIRQRTKFIHFMLGLALKFYIAIKAHSYIIDCKE